MSELYYESPLANVAEPQGLAVSLREMPDRGMIDLRGELTDKSFMAAAKDVLGVGLPTKPRTTVSWGDIKVLWLSIDQWLVLCPRGKTAELLGSLREALSTVHAHAVDVSDMRTVIRMEGDSCREVLMKGTSLDLLSEEYAAGSCRRMRFAEIAALLDVVDDEIFDIYVFRSFAHYAWEFLNVAAREPAKVKLFGRQDVAV